MNIYKYVLFSYFLLLFVPLHLKARPVSYAGGWTLITQNNGHYNMGNLHYSPTVDFSVGYQGEYWRKHEYQSHYAMLNILVKRYNTEDSQANFYIKSGLGESRSDHSIRDRTAVAAFTGIAVDWEDRRFFVSYSNRFLSPGVQGFFQIHKARLGFAPYVGEYGDLHTWIMVQPEYTSHRKRPWEGTVLLRFFKKAHLFEIGVNNLGKIMLNYTYRL